MSRFFRFDRYIAGTIRKAYLKRPIFVLRSPVKISGALDHSTETYVKIIKIKSASITLSLKSDCIFVLWDGLVNVVKARVIEKAPIHHVLML